MSGEVAAITPDSVEHEPGDELELVGEHVLAVHRRRRRWCRRGWRSCPRDRDPAAGVERAGVLPRRRVGHAAAVGILGRFRDPQAAASRPSRCSSTLAMSGSAATSVRSNSGCTSIFAAALAGWVGPPSDVAQRIAHLVLLQELVEVRPLAGPRDAAQQDRAVVRPVEVLVEMAGDRHERAVRGAAALGRPLVGPHLRLDVVDADALAAAGQLVGALLHGRVARPGGLRRVRRRPGPAPPAGCPCRSRSRRPSPSWRRPG